MERSEFVVWGEMMGQVASDLVRLVHALNEVERTPRIEELQRNLVELAICCWGLGDRLLVAGHRPAALETQRTR